MKSAKRWLVLLVFLPALIFFAFTNYYIDPNDQFHNDSIEMAKAMLDGNTIYIESYVNEREIKKNVIIGMTDDVDCIVMGSSEGRTIDSGMAGTDSFYNLSVASADMYDVLAQFGLMELYGKTPKRIIISLDNYFFDEDVYKFNQDAIANHEGLYPYAQYMLGILGVEDETVELQKENPFDISLFSKVQTLFSLKYFQASMDVIEKLGAYGGPLNRLEFWGIENGQTSSHPSNTIYYRPDASYIYSDDIVSRTADDVKNISNSLDVYLLLDSKISDYSLKVLNKLVEHLYNKGIEVEFFLSPISPSFWDRIVNEYGGDSAFDGPKQLMYDMAEQYGCKIIGGFNPHDFEIEDSDYYDATHMRAESLAKYFDFSSNF